MKYILLAIFFFHLTCTCFSQQDSTAFIVGDAIKSLKKIDSIVYVNKAVDYYTPICEIAKKGDVTGLIGTTKVSFHLKKSEIKFLDNEFKKTTYFTWPENMFNNSIRIPSDSIRYFRPYKIPPSNNRYFQFSRILYLRNYTVALFRLDEMFHESAGYSYLFFYIKKDTQWQLYVKVDYGAF